MVSNTYPPPATAEEPATAISPRGNRTLDTGPTLRTGAEPAGVTLVEDRLGQGRKGLPAPPMHRSAEDQQQIAPQTRIAPLQERAVTTLSPLTTGRPSHGGDLAVPNDRSETGLLAAHRHRADHPGEGPVPRSGNRQRIDP